MTFTTAKLASDWLLSSDNVIVNSVREKLQANPDIKVEDKQGKFLIQTTKFQCNLFQLLEFRQNGIYLGNLTQLIPSLADDFAHKLPNDAEFIVQHILAVFAGFDLEFVINQHIRGVAIPLTENTFSVKQMGKVWLLKVKGPHVMIDDFQGHRYWFTESSLIANLEQASSKMND